MKKKRKFSLASLMTDAMFIVLFFICIAIDSNGGGGAVTIGFALCGRLSSNFQFLCPRPLQGGTEDEAVFINWDDWQNASITRNGDNPRIIEGIDLPSGTTGYLIQGKRNSNLPSYASVTLPFFEGWNHFFNFKVFGIGPDEKEQLQNLLQGRGVIVYKNKFRGVAGETVFEVLGANGGLVVPDGGIARDPNSTETQGAVDVRLETDERNKETFAPDTIFLTDFQTSEDIFNSLYSA